MNLNEWDDDAHRAMAHPTKRRIIECLRDADLSFTELLNAAEERNHGKFGHHLRKLKAFVELEPSTKKYRLTDRGRLLAAAIQNFRSISSIGGRSTNYVQQLRLKDHAVAFYDTQDFRRRITFPFLKAGLSKGEAVIYLVPEHRIDSEFREIQRYCINFEHLLGEGFAIMSADEWYLKKGKAEAQTIISNWVELIEEKKKAGFSGVHAAGEMDTFFDNAKTEELLIYEKSLGQQLTIDLCGLCLYDRDRLEEKQFVHLFKCHGHLISKSVVGKTIL
jgi:DNA-binding transcriptional ArsR family regulator